MTPKEKAIELRDKYYEASRCTIAGAATIFYQNSKNLAIIAVDEILNFQKIVEDIFPKDSDGYTSTYWEDVKAELSKL